MTETTPADAAPNDTATGGTATGDTGADSAAEPERHAGAVVTWSRGQEVLHPTRASYLDTIRRLRDEEGFVLCVDVTAVDYLEYPPRDLPEGTSPERFEVVVNLVAFDPPRRIRVRVQVPGSDARLPTLWDLYPGAEAYEREVYDLMGIVFDDHPDLTRILMPEDWEGHPLRKDYPVGTVPVQFKAAPPTR
jgi:NADH-quinone oxidoreductase subunit C